jgi:hypothetical protein
MGAVTATKARKVNVRIELDRMIKGGVNFALLSDRDAGYVWYLPNTRGPVEHEDWVFHALRHGTASDLDTAVTELADAARLVYPDSDFAKVGRRG